MVDGKYGVQGDEPARRAAEKPQLMAGENPTSIEPGDALHWISVYSELLAFKASVLAEMTGTSSGVDVALMKARQQRYRERLAFWEDRARQIAGMNPPSIKGGK